MPVSTTGLNQGLNRLADRLKYVGLIGATGSEISGGDPVYARIQVTWNAALGGIIALPANVSFNVPAGSVVTGYQMYDNPRGGTSFGAVPLTPVTYVAQGTYLLPPESAQISVTSS